MYDNLLLMTDSYKTSHYRQYPKNITKVYSYIESRGGKFDKTVFFGLQYLLRILEKGFTRLDVEEAQRVIEAQGLPFNKKGFLYILEKYEGRLPVKIQALPEGSVARTHVPLVSIENTDPKCAWLTSYLEIMLLRVWYPITVATYSREVKKVIKKYMEQTADDMETLPYKLHDFGARGVSSHESAGIGGLAHLVNFEGSDTIEAIQIAQKVYHCETPSTSIPAMEHSTVCAWTREGELEAYENMIKEFGKPGALISMVADSYNLYDAIDMFGTLLKDQIKESGATIVVRPDSGDPIEIVLETLDRLGKHFGYTENSKGFKVLNNVRVIQGDGVNLESIEEILIHVTWARWSTSNLAFGMGGALLQRLDRDTQKFAMKESYVEVGDGNGYDVYKDPITDPGKMSKKGRQDNPDFVTVFEDGKILKEWTLDEIRRRADG
jgi:nicotinamide phosphoribosyltransferase